jgi:SAM-dependent methyltransferase
MNHKNPDVDRFDDRLAAVYSRTENKEQQYDEWAKTYDSDLLDDLGYVAFREASDIFIDVVPDRNCRVLDVACGTGLAGEYLKQHGYQNIDGVDLSGKMMAIARQREVYHATWQHDFTGPADLNELYDAVLCVGMFSYAIPKISDMHNVVNCARPGATCVITINGAAWQELELEPEVYREADLNGFTIEEIRKARYIEKEGIDSRVLVITRKREHVLT